MKNYAIKPSQVAKTKKSVIPKGVFDAFNELIAKNFGGGSADVGQEEAVKLACKKLKIKDSEFEDEWLNIEEVYEAAGWKVDYDKPCYYGGDNYKPFYTFTKK